LTKLTINQEKHMETSALTLKVVKSEILEAVDNKLSNHGKKIASLVTLLCLVAGLVYSVWFRTPKETEEKKEQITEARFAKSENEYNSLAEQVIILKDHDQLRTKLER